MHRIGVIILNIGGPEREQDIPRFLRSMLSDPDMVDLPGLLRVPFAWLISVFRSKPVAERYRTLGGGSPIGKETRSQVAALGQQLGDNFVVRHAFRHAVPRIDGVVAELVGAGVDRIVALPAFPQRSRTTTGSALKDLARAAEPHGIDIVETSSFPDGEGYIESLVANSLPLLEDATHVLLTAHGLPRRTIEKGDPYVDEVQRTVEAFAAQLPPGTPHSLAYQSRLGPVEWTRPYLTDEIGRLAKEGVRSLVVVPISFASDCLESLYELGIEVAELAKNAGIESYRVAPAPGCHPGFIKELSRRVHDAVNKTAWVNRHAS